jgi:hypothetical protein
VCCERLGLEVVPEAYLLQMGGAFNAFATRFLGNNFIVLYSDVVDALEERPDAINFYIGHEIGHIKRNHLRWSALLAPAAFLPLLGAAYARAREYTCDRHGFHACDDLKSAQVGLAALAAGGKRWRQMSVSTYTAQAQQSGGFWMSFHELVGDYPWLVKRMAVVRGLAQGRKCRRRAATAWPICWPCSCRAWCRRRRFVLGVIALIGVLAAVASRPTTTTPPRRAWRRRWRSVMRRPPRSSAISTPTAAARPRWNRPATRWTIPATRCRKSRSMPATAWCACSRPTSTIAARLLRSPRAWTRISAWSGNAPATRSRRACCRWSAINTKDCC